MHVFARHLHILSVYTDIRINVPSTCVFVVTSGLRWVRLGSEEALSGSLSHWERSSLFSGGIPGPQIEVGKRTRLCMCLSQEGDTFHFECAYLYSCIHTYIRVGPPTVSMARVVILSLLRSSARHTAALFSKFA